jgi:putative ABC transport system substrate-binding protein
MMISRSIRPYIEAADGAVATLRQGKLDVETFLVNKMSEGDGDALKRSIRENTYDLLLAVGPEASDLAWSFSKGGELPVVYTMVLSPEKLANAPPAPCGISLGIPIELQLQFISKTLPSAKKIGLLFDPGNNAAFFETAERLGAADDIAVIPLGVSSKKEIAQTLTKNWRSIDGLWLIPDRTVISESVVQYIIKQALLNDTPVVGYNRFFYDSGAAVSFVFDYAHIGEQAGRLALSIIENLGCQTAGPAFQTWVNARVLEKLGMQASGIGGSVILK